MARDLLIACSLLFQCIIISRLCHFSSYCMRVCLNSIPEHWYCEECEKKKNGKSSPTCALDLSKASNSSSRRVVQNDFAQPPNRARLQPYEQRAAANNKKLQTGRKVKPLSLQEVIALNSGTKKSKPQVKVSSSRQRANYAMAQPWTSITSEKYASRISVLYYMYRSKYHTFESFIIHWNKMSWMMLFIWTNFNN